MDYFGILKKAWQITWKYKALWVLGLFAGVGSGGSGGGGGGNSGYSTGGGDMSSSADAFTRWLSENLLLVAVVGGLLAVVGLVLWVLAIAAQGAIVHGTNEAAAGRAPSLRASWGVGFAKWGRTFMIGFVIGLPVLVAVLLMLGMIFGLGVGGAMAGSDGGTAAALGGMCIGFLLFFVVIVFLSIVIAVVQPLALRYGVLEDVTFGKALKAGWDDLWGKRGAFVFALVMLLPQFAFSAVVLAVLLPFAVPAVIAFAGERYVMAGALFVLMMIVAMLPGAVYSTFVHSSWTLFFREMTDRKRGLAAGSAPQATVVDPAPVPAAPMYAAPPVPPAYDAPPAPPAIAAPPAPDAGPPADA